MSNEINLRDYFAAKALQSLISASTTMDDRFEESFGNATLVGLGCELTYCDENDKPYTYTKYWAECAYDMADAMIAARDKKQESGA